MATSANQIFSRFTAQPSYGASKAGLTWNISSALPGAKIIIFRSIYGGMAPWELITAPSGIAASGGFFEDDISGANENSARKIFYRACVLHQGTEYDSPVIGFTSWLAPNEMKAVARILRNEMRLMHTHDRGDISGNGVPMLMFSPLEEGIPCPDFDVLTKQQVGQGGRPGPNDCYGMAYIGGFGPAQFTWMRLLKTEQGLADNAGGAGTVFSNSVRARFLAFPRPMPDMMVVNPATDDRYIIASSVDEFLFKGVLPIAYDAQLNRLERSSPKYRLPVSMPAYPV